MITNKQTMRENNKRVVLSQIFNNTSTTRTDISKQTRLNKVSVSEIVAELIAEKLVIEDGSGDSTNLGGRKPIRLKINPFAAGIISIDIGKDYIYASLFLLNGEEVSSLRYEDVYATNKNIVANIKYIYDEFLLHIESEGIYLVHSIIGMSLAIHGVVLNNDVYFTPHYDLEHGSFLTELKELFDFDIYLENEANLSALGEYAFTDYSNDMISVSIHNGFGAGIVLNGSLYKGVTGQAGEVGHMIIDPQGILCNCGNHGCIENYISYTAMKKKFSKVLSKELGFNDLKNLNYHQKNLIYPELETIAEITSVGINNIISNYNPSIIYINSPITEIFPEYIDLISKNLKNKVTNDTVIKTSDLKGNAILIGGFVNTVQIKLGLDGLNFSRQIQ